MAKFLRQGVTESEFCFQSINVAEWKMQWKMGKIEPNSPSMWQLQRI